MEAHVMLYIYWVFKELFRIRKNEYLLCLWWNCEVLLSLVVFFFMSFSMYRLLIKYCIVFFQFIQGKFSMIRIQLYDHVIGHIRIQFLSSSYLTEKQQCFIWVRLYNHTDSNILSWWAWLGQALLTTYRQYDTII